VNPAALLPNEKPCPDCEDGKVDVSYPCTSSTAEEPAMASEHRAMCPRCDGTRVVINENRAKTRPTGSIAAEFTALRNLVAFQQATIDALITEKSALRKVIHDQSRLLEVAEPIQ
jgi:transposase